MFLMDLRLQLESFLPIKAVRGSRGKGVSPERPSRSEESEPDCRISFRMWDKQDNKMRF